SEGHYRWFLVRAEPVRDVRGEVAQWFGAATDVHEQRSALESLRESELRFRTLVEGMPQLVWRAKRGGRWSWASPQWTYYTGLSENASYGLGWLRALHPDDRAAAEAGWAAAGDSEPVHIEARIYCKPESRYRHFRIRANPVVADSGRLIEWLGTSTDIDDLLELHARQDVMVAELQHRTRNLIGVVRSIALQTLTSSDSLESFQTEFEHRLAALSRVQGLLSRAEDQRITIGALIRLELEALGHPSVGDRVVIEGPEVPLRKSMVQTLALAIHELATNARKYGALSENRGTLRIGWQLEQGTEDTAPQLFVDWSELTPPRQERATDAVRTSFGRELIESALPYSLGAQTTFELSDRALHCTIRLPLTQPRRDSGSASPVA
ncbi:MAG: PAS domain S-box protein, partial [Proteobacteria bacterium]